ncbi:MAG TPA: class I SAM-dependent methyltransferase [Propionibacteriaceae bacterium]|nr:class I SAM-dependent methyltransferase [Propionibacteriaceae bacterium]
MSSTPRRPYPEAVPGWMVGDQRARVLDVGCGNGAFAEMLHESGHEVFAIDRNLDTVALLPERLGTRLHVVGQVESLPYRSCHFEVVTASQSLHRFAPGLALTEIARVLKPGGRLAVAYNTRDDTVPWVRRLIALMQQADPEAMKGDYGVDSVDAVAESPYFVDLEQRNFRNWVPITRAGLLGMVERRPTTARLEPDVRARLLAEIGDLYDTSARAPEPLLLPYQASCWRAVVDHSGLALDAAGEALHIRL